MVARTLVIKNAANNLLVLDKLTCNEATEDSLLFVAVVFAMCISHVR
jgi:hypothetical protein